MYALFTMQYIGIGFVINAKPEVRMLVLYSRGAVTIVKHGCFGGATVRRRFRDRKVAGSTPGRGAIKSTRSTPPSIPPGEVNRVPACMTGVRRGAFTCVGWQVTLCDPIWQVTSRNSEIGFPWRAILAFTFTFGLWGKMANLDSVMYWVNECKVSFSPLQTTNQFLQGPRSAS